jgi:hypothetical protein
MIETSTQRYRRLRKETEVLHNVKCANCGMDWKCYLRSMQFWIETGVMPTELATKVAKIFQGGAKTEAELMAAMPAHLVDRSVEFTAKLVRMTVAEPRIVEFPQEGEDELGFDEVMTCCYETIRNFQTRQGGGQAESLENFPTE